MFGYVEDPAQRRKVQQQFGFAVAVALLIIGLAVYATWQLAKGSPEYNSLVFSASDKSSGAYSGRIMPIRVDYTPPGTKKAIDVTNQAANRIFASGANCTANYTVDSSTWHEDGKAPPPPGGSVRVLMRAQA
jgi:hypothetical protein